MLNLKFKIMRNLKRKTSLLGLFLIIAMVVTAQPYGQNGYHKQANRNNGNYGQGYGNSNHFNRMAEFLNLTDEQQKKVTTMRLEHQKKMLPMRNELNEKKARMRTLSTAESADMKAINSLIDEMGVIKTKMAKERAANRQEMRKLLTDEQRVMFDSHAGKKGMNGRGKGAGYGNGRCGRY